MKNWALRARCRIVCLNTRNWQKKAGGLDGGVVCSPLEVRLLKAELGPEFLAVTPGVRPLGTEVQDQKRTLTPPQEAINAGSDYLVVGRPILKAADPQAAFLKILEEIEVQP